MAPSTSKPLRGLNLDSSGASSQPGEFFLQPVSFFIFLVAGIAESKRIPFDLPEAESELIAGYFTEYSGSKQMVFMLVDFVEIVIVAALVTTLFFGGWQVPFLTREGFGLSMGRRDWAAVACGGGAADGGFYWQSIFLWLAPDHDPLDFAPFPI